MISKNGGVGDDLVDGAVVRINREIRQDLEAEGEAEEAGAEAGGGEEAVVKPGTAAEAVTVPGKGERRHEDEVRLGGGDAGAEVGVRLKQAESARDELGGAGDAVGMTGPAEHVFDGEIDIPDLSNEMTTP